MSDRNPGIYSVGLACNLGPKFAVAAAAYANGDRKFRRYKSVVGVDGLPMTLASVIPYDEIRDYPERLLRLTDMALSDLDTRCPIPPGTTFHVMLQAWIQNNSLHDEIKGCIAYAAGRKAMKVKYHYGSAAEALALIGKGASAVTRGDVETVVVGAVDSFMQAELLDRMAVQGRIPSRMNPYGGIPGEAACALLLSTGRTMRGIEKTGDVLAVFRGAEAEDVAQPAGIIGRGLASPYRHAAAYHTPDRLISDLNGERWRAEEFGFAVTAAGPALSGLVKGVETPALQMGDCGTAAAPLMAALALTDPPGRGHPNNGPITMVSASSRLGPRTVMFIERFVPA